MSEAAARVAVIPAHDEAGTIEDVVRRATPHVDLVLVVDDGSSDDTAARAEALGARVLRLRPNRGKGGALVAGLAEATRSGAQRVVTLDADGEHDPDEIPSLLARLDTHDVVLGWREVYRSGARRVLNGIALFWFRVLDPSIRDTICGFRAFRAEALAQVQNDAGGFAYEHEVILRAVAAGLRVTSVPIATVPSQRSHVTPREIVRANNHFDRWVLRELGRLPIPLWRKGILAIGCLLGLALGVPAQRWLDRRAARR